MKLLSFGLVKDATGACVSMTKSPSIRRTFPAASDTLTRTWWLPSARVKLPSTVALSATNDGVTLVPSRNTWTEPASTPETASLYVARTLT